MVELDHSPLTSLTSRQISKQWSDNVDSHPQPLTLRWTQWSLANGATCWLQVAGSKFSSLWGLSQNSDTPASTVVAVQSLCHAPAQERNQAATWGCIPHHVSGSPWSHLMSFIWLIVTPKKIEINSPLFLDWIVWFYLFGDCYIYIYRYIYTLW